MLFPNVIFDVAKGYNNAYILVEVNDIGDQVKAYFNMIWNMKTYLCVDERSK